MPQKPAKRRISLHRKKKVHKNSFAGHKPDLILLATVIGLCLFGLLMIYNVSAYEGFHSFGDKFYFAKQQAIWLVLSGIAGIFGYRLHYTRWLKLSPLFLGGVLVLLIAVLIPGVGQVVLGARRWIALGPVTVQPAELIKPAILLYFAAWLSGKDRTFDIRKLLQFGVVAGLVVGLVMLEPDMGTTIVIVSSIASLYFAAGAPISQFLVMIPVGVMGFVVLMLKSSYRLKRFMTFLHPQIDPQGASYHISQILLTLGSGGLFGVGLGNSAQKYGYLPEASTDSIFAVVGGELGFVGALVLIGVYLWLLQRAFVIVRYAPDRASYLLAMGITLWFGMQTVINMGSMVALFPLTGIPLPFISYGGSSLVTAAFAVGVLLNISRHTVGKRTVNGS